MTPINLKQLSEQLGLTPSTVSRALNNYQDISLATRERVQKTANELGYKPSRIAQQLARGKHRVDTVGYVLPIGVHRFSDPFFANFITGVGNALAEAERDLLITTPSKKIPELDVYKRLLRENKVNGFLLSRTRSQDERIAFLVKQKVPFVAHGRTLKSSHYSWYDVDLSAGATLVAKRFLKQGHQRIGFITPPQHFNFARIMESAFRNTLKGQATLACAEGDMSEASGLTLTQQWLAKASTCPTAIFCGTDAMAVGVMRAIQQAGLKVGHDIAVIGYGDFPIATYVSPTLTTLRQPLADAGRQVTEMLMQQLKNPKADPEHILLAPELIERESDQYKPNYL